jgi:integrase
MLALDLADAGIPRADRDGRVVDFHALRTTFITGLARAGVMPAMAQKLARHSDINLTLGVYTQLQLNDLAEAVAKLPVLWPNVVIDEQRWPAAS